MLVIRDRNQNIAFELNTKNQSYQSYNQTLLGELEDGIFIPPFARSISEGKKIVHLPDSDKGNKKSFEIFEKAMEFFFNDTLKQDGFKMTISKN